MFLTFLTLLLLHPVHETVSEIQWNGQTKSTEIALRLHVLDEQWILKQPVPSQPDKIASTEIAKPSQAKVADEAKTENERQIAYLSRHYQLLGFESERAIAMYRWVGRKEEGAHVWWYFEVSSDDQSRPTSIDVSLLFEHNSNYTHRVLFLDETPRQSVTLTHTNHRADLPRASALSVDAIESQP